MNDRPDQPAEGKLLADALKRTGLSQRKAADKAGMSEGHWRAIATGSRSVSAGVWMPVRAPADTLARMARVVGITPEEFEVVGRADAAQELRELSTRGDRIRTTEDHLDDSEAILAELRERLERLSPRRRRAVLHVVRELGEEETDTG